MTTFDPATETQVSRAQNLIDATWQGIRDSFSQRIADGRPLDGLPDLSEDAADRTSRRAIALLSDHAAIDAGLLPHQLALTLRVARFLLETEAQAHSRFWLAQDQGMFPAMFPTGAYGGGMLLAAASRALAGFEFTRRSDGDRYLALVEDYANLLDQMRDRLVGQAARGIRIPRPALPGARSLLASYAQSARSGLTVSADRARAATLGVDYGDRVDRRIETRVEPAFSALLALLDDEYAALAPAEVGLGRFDGGIPVYESLIAQQLTMPRSIDDVHRIGVERMAELDEEMAALRAILGHPDRDDCHRYLRTAPAWIGTTPEAVQAHFERSIARIEPHVASLFRFAPKAHYRAAPLDAKLEAGMTAGYYQYPMAGHPDGVYYFNASNATKTTLVGATSLIYHELVPGHHFHMATQRENTLLHPLRQTASFNAFTEGWAEYAATLAGEIGMFDDPHERYGRLLKQAYTTARLVVDTGLNALGWSLERAAQYMTDHVDLTEKEIGSELLRYSTDIPAQSLAYMLGELRFRELREHARERRGADFDIRDFHDVVLGSGGMPFETLEWHVDQWLDGATPAPTA